MGGNVDSSVGFGMQNFFCCATDTSDGTYDYYGYTNKKGSTLIMRTTKTLSSIKYYTATGDFDTIWAAKAGYTYIYPTAMEYPSV